MVIISAWGSLNQAYHLALACQERDILEKFYTTFYYKKRFPYKLLTYVSRRLFPELQTALSKRALATLNDRHIACKVTSEVLFRFSGMFGRNKGGYSPIFPFFDKQIARNINDCDVFYGYENTALYSMRKVKKLGGTAILELRSLQPWYNEIVEEENQRLGLPVPSYLGSKKFTEFMEAKWKEMDVADYIVIYSNRSKEYLMERHTIPPSKIKVIPVGVDIEIFSPKHCDARLTDRHEFKILFVGQICARKGVIYLLEAVKQLDIKDIKLQLIGSVNDGMKAILERYSKYFDYVGTVHRNRLVEYYCRANVFVLPSLLDSFGSVIYEAMMSGIPVVITENCGANIRNGKDGFVVPIRDVEALKEKILFLYENRSLCEEMGRSAIQWAKQHSWADYRERAGAAMLEILGKSNGKG